MISLFSKAWGRGDNEVSEEVENNPLFHRVVRRERKKRRKKTQRQRESEFSLVSLQGSSSGSKALPALVWNHCCGRKGSVPTLLIASAHHCYSSFIHQGRARPCFQQCKHWDWTVQRLPCWILQTLPQPRINRQFSLLSHTNDPRIVNMRGERTTEICNPTSSFYKWGN